MADDTGKNRLLKLFVYILPLFASDDCPTILKDPKETKVFGETRVKLIKNWDKLLTWTLSSQYHEYVYAHPPEEKFFRVTGKDLFLFDENYGYFSIQHPILGTVTKSERDIKATQCLLNALSAEISDPTQRAFTSYEILNKIMAYRPLQKGMHVQLPSSAGVLTYVVDEVIDLWRGMPAFGLVPQGKGDPILVFRGTDVNLTTEKAWASIVADLDITGPGLTTFLRAQDKIHAWLKKMADNKTPAFVTGYSLGGVFVFFTMIYEHALLNKKHPSMAFNPPGIAADVLKKWKEIPIEQRPPHEIYVNAGDFVSQIGFLLPNVWEVALDHPMGVIESHVTFISAQPIFTLRAVDVAAENALRKKRQQ